MRYPQSCAEPRGRWAALGLCLVALAMACTRPTPSPTPVSEVPPGPPIPQLPIPPPPTAPAEGRDDALRLLSPEEVPLLIDSGELDGLRRSLTRSRRWLAARPDRELLFGPRTVRARELARAYADFDRVLASVPSPEALAAWVARRFEIYGSAGDGTGEMLVTGYYEPLIPGSRRRTAQCSVPVYGHPGNMIRIHLGDFRESLKDEGRLLGRLEGNRLVPIPSRGEMRRSGEFLRHAFAWACDPVDLFFVEIQGSGALIFGDGSEMRIGYAGANGREYRSIGRLLIDEGEIPREQMSMQALRHWLAENPGEVHRVLDHNESVVFFRRLPGEPTGNLGLPVTAERSIATDQKLFPPGTLAFLLTEIPDMAPDGSTVAAGALGRFVLNQDTGGAIRGSARVDFFWGRGDLAAKRAGLMKQPGGLYFLVPRGS